VIKKIYSKEEFLETTKLEEERLEAFLKAQILKPAGKVDGSIPYFDDSAIVVADAIKKLLEIGYSMEDVIRIRRKVGLPRTDSARDSKEEYRLTVGELAKRIGTNPRTIKHWEEKGIIEPDSHSPGGFRLYDESYVELCMLLQDLQNLGYTLDEIKIVADLVRDFLVIQEDYTVFPPERIREKFTQIMEQIKILNEKMKTVEEGIRRWRKIQKEHQKELNAVLARVEKQLDLDAKEAKKKETKRTPEREPAPA
jgi:DNA-binding transcriptional MerR regulator